jgi:hypothetical protein
MKKGNLNLFLYTTTIYKNTFVNRYNYKRELNANYTYDKMKQIKVTVHIVLLFSPMAKYNS